MSRVRAETAVIVTGRSLADPDGLLGAVTEAMRGRCAGVFAETIPHVPRATATAAAEFIRAKRADAVVSFGGSTPSDTAKGAVWAIAAGVEDPKDFGPFAMRFEYPATRVVPAMPGRALPIYGVPTTLSAGEFTNIAGMTDAERGEKQLYQDPKLGARAVFLDPGMTVETPEALWLSSGVKAIDHCVEAWFSTSSQAVTDALAGDALASLMRCLPQTRGRTDDLEARLNCQVAAWCSVFGLANVSLGLSHGLGHQLGAHCGVAHGLTSCAVMAPVVDFNRPVTAERTEILCRRLAPVLGRHIGPEDFGEALKTLIRDDLNLPYRLRDMAVTRDDLRHVAHASLNDPIVATNPRPIRSAADVAEVLEAAW